MIKHDMSRKNMNKYDFSERLDVFLKDQILTAKGLAGELSISDALINDMKNKRLKGRGIKFWRGIRSKYPQWESYLRGDATSPPSAGQRTDISLRDVAAARHLQSSVEKINEEPSTFLVSHPVDKYKVIAEVGEILDSGNADIISALVKNVQEFKRAVDQAKRLYVCEDELKEVREEIAELRKQVARLSSPATGADRRGASLGKRGT